MRRAEGARWEQYARDHLLRSGLTLITENFHSRFGEIDLIMSEQSMLVIVEVRYRRAAVGPGAVESVDTHKQRKLMRATQFFLLRQPRWQQASVRFDVVAIEPGNDGEVQIQWLRDAFRAG